MATQVAAKRWWQLKLSTVQLAWLALVCNSIVILQGAVVRITHSGAGCGEHWPLCHGEVIPLLHSLEVALEFGHRLLSLGVLIIGVWMLRRGWRERKALPGFYVFALWSLIFLVTQALLGAATVLFGLTGDNVSIARGLMLPTHLVNSLLIIGSLTLSLIYATPHAYQTIWPLKVGQQGGVATVLLIGIIGMLVLTFSGGIAAASNTMFPSDNLLEGLAADFSPDSHPLIRLRILHPILGVTIGIYLFLSLGLSRLLKPVASAKSLTQALFFVYLIQLVVGTLSLVLLTPIALQLLHLTLSLLAFGLLTAVFGHTLGGQAETSVWRIWRARVKEA
jgi:cytochrome c oxidase assembly protein subunit 15